MSRKLSKLLNLFLVLILIFCFVVNIQKGFAKTKDFKSISTLIIDQTSQNFDGISIPSNNIENPDQFPLLDDPRKLDYCQFNITNTVIDDYFFSFCPSNESVFDPDFINPESNNITINLNMEIFIQSSCYASLNLTLPIPGLDGNSFTIDFLQVTPGSNLKSFIYSFNKVSNNQLYRNYLPFIREECTLKSSLFRRNSGNMAVRLYRPRFDVGDFVDIIRKVPGKVISNTIDLVGDVTTLISAPYVGIPLIGIKYIVSVLDAFIQSNVAAVNLVKISIRVIQGTDAPLAIIYGYFKLLQPLINGAFPIVVVNKNNNPIAPVVDAFGEILEKIVYPPILDKTPNKEQIIDDYVTETVNYIKNQLNERQIEEFCLQSNFIEFFNTCIKSQTGGNCNSLYTNICE